MDSICKNIFCQKQLVFSKLVPFGFTYEKGVYIYTEVLSGSGFILSVSITDRGDILSEIVDPSLGEAYTLHLSKAASGSFVGRVREQYESVLKRIAESCAEPDVFKSRQTKAVIEYVRSKYDDRLEFLWDRFPDNAIWRRADNKKWYGALLTVSKRKLGIDSDVLAEIIDLRIQPEKIKFLIDNKRYFPGWHMNKKNWYTIILDGSVPLDEIKDRIDTSYLIAKK